MMRRAVLLFLCCAAMEMHAQAPEAVDMIFLNDAAGTRRAGKIVGFDGGTLRLEVPLAAGNAAKATVSVSLGDVDRIEFAPDPARERLLADPAAPASALAGEWRRWEPFIALPKSPAPAVGNAYAAALLREPKQAEDALGLFSRIEREAWSPEERQAAGRGRLRGMVATGRAAEAVGEARRLAEESEDPSVLIEAKFILAEAAFSELKALVEANPRWREDLRVRSEYERLYNDALDLYLHPALFLGSETEAAARGLWGAVQVYQFGGDPVNAAETAKDIVMLYPKTPFAKLGRQALEALPEKSKDNAGKTEK